jgi:hypothetical protein
MMKRAVAKLSYANVVATLALFIALGGSSYAITQVTGREIRDHSIQGRDVARGTLTGKHIAEDRLGAVPRARVAGHLTPRGSKALLLRCPKGTALAAGLCFEETAHQPLTYDEALGSCAATNAGNRRLAAAAELVAYFSAGGDIAPGGELTSSVFESRSVAGQLDVVVLANEQGFTRFAPAFPFNGPGTRLPYRCVAPATNIP